MHQKNYIRGMDQLIVNYKITKYTFIRVSIRWRNSYTRKAINSLILSSEKVKNNQSNKSSNLQKEVQENSQCCKRMCKWNLNNWPEIKHHDNNRNIKNYFPCKIWNAWTFLTCKHGEHTASWHGNKTPNCKG